MHEYPGQVIPISYHTYFEGSSIDDIGIGLNGTYSRHFKVGATLNLNINRKEWNLSIMPGSKEQNKVTWYEKAELATEAIAAVAVVHSWDSVSREISGEVVVTFEEAPTGDEISVGMFIVEDSVIGGPRYDQYTDYYYHGNYPELEEWGTTIEADSVHFASGHWIEGYPHHWSFRESVLAGDFWGVTDKIPANAVVGKEYRIPFTHTLPADYHGLDVREKQVALVALVSYKEKEAINAESVNLVDDAVSISSGTGHFVPSVQSVVWKNGEVHCVLPRKGTYDVKIHSLLGRELYSSSLSTNQKGVRSLEVSQGFLPAGTYLISLEQNGNRLSSSRCIIR